MTGIKSRYLLLVLLGLIAVPVSGQTIKNPKLSSDDRNDASSAAKAVQGDTAELVYAARLDAVEKGKYDSLVVISSIGAGKSRRYIAQVVRSGNSLKLIGGENGTALPAGDEFLRMGLRYQEGKAGILRLMSRTPEEKQRNLDFQFNGTEFVLLGQSETSVAR